jgi:hypothetical protein
VTFEEFTGFMVQEISGQKTHTFQDIEAALGRA